MRVDPNSPAAVASSKPNVKGPETAAAPAGDRVEANGHSAADGPKAGSAAAKAADALGDWAKNEWTTLAGAAHGVASAPGVVSHAWQTAARTNAELGTRISGLVDTWEHTPPEARGTAIEALHAAAKSVSSAASAVATELAGANGVAGGGALPPDVAARARDTAKVLESTATAQFAKAQAWIPGVSRVLGATVADVHEGFTGTASALARVPVLNKTPLLGVLLTGAGTANDIRAGVDPVVATVANVSSTVAGVVAGDVATTAIASALGLGLTDAGAATLGAAVATGPVGLAVVGGVIAGAAVGYGVYKAVESRPGQEAVAGTLRVVQAVSHEAAGLLRG